MIDSDGRRKSNWALTLAIVVWALLACVLVISLARQKIAVEQKVEEKLWADETRPKPSPQFVPFGPQENEN